jgi:hypothetical protein
MPRYRIKLEQWVQEVAEIEIEADTLLEAHQAALDHPDLDWSAGSEGTSDPEVVFHKTVALDPAIEER